MTDKWDVSAIVGQTVIVTAESMPITIGTIVDQDIDSVTLQTAAGRSVIIAKSMISSITQQAMKEV